MHIEDVRARGRVLVHEEARAPREEPAAHPRVAGAATRLHAHAGAARAEPLVRACVGACVRACGRGDGMRASAQSVHAVRVRVRVRGCVRARGCCGRSGRRTDPASKHSYLVARVRGHPKAFELPRYPRAAAYDTILGYCRSAVASEYRSFSVYAPANSGGDAVRSVGKYAMYSAPIVSWEPIYATCTPSAGLTRTNKQTNKQTNTQTNKHTNGERRTRPPRHRCGTGRPARRARRKARGRLRCAAPAAGPAAAQARPSADRTSSHSA